MGEVDTPVQPDYLRCVRANARVFLLTRALEDVLNKSKGFSSLTNGKVVAYPSGGIAVMNCNAHAWLTDLATSAIVIAVLLVGLAHGQQSPGGQPEAKIPNLYEDEYIRLTFLPGWDLQPRYEENGDRGVLLTKGNYKLLLRYRTGHASGIIGGRLSEALKLPWLADGEDQVDCSSRLQDEPRSVSAGMRFYDLIMDGSDCDTRVNCRIKWKKIGVRWVGGYFSPGEGAYFFGPHDSRAFTLIYDTNAPDYLPVKGGAITERVITEAAMIVKSIHYKTPPERMSCDTSRGSGRGESPALIVERWRAQG